MAIAIAERVLLSANEETPINVACDKWLDPACDGEPETLAALLSVVELNSSDLTIDRLEVNDECVWIKERRVEIGQAFSFWVQGQQAGRSYEVRARFRTTMGRIAERDITIKVERE